MSTFMREPYGEQPVWLGLVLAAADRSKGTRTADKLGLRDAITIGAAQAVALAPGVSRSGVTISAARWLGFDRDSAARVSFLMSLPIIGGAAIGTLIAATLRSLKKRKLAAA